MYYKLRCNSTQFVIYYKLRNYYKLQRNSCTHVNLLTRYSLFDMVEAEHISFPTENIEATLSFRIIIFVHTRMIYM